MVANRIECMRPPRTALSTGELLSLTFHAPADVNVETRLFGPFSDKYYIYIYISDVMYCMVDK